MAEPAIQALLVEDSEPVAAALRALLEEDGRFAISRVDHLAALAGAVAATRFDVILLDLSLPDSAGLATVERARSAAATIPIVVLTSADDDSLGRQAVRLGAEDYLVKDQVDERLIYRAVSHAIERMRLRGERDRLIDQLSAALAEVKQLSGLLPICAQCKKIRDDQGYWKQIERYIREHSDAEFTHGICPDCARDLYGEYLAGGES